MRLVALLLASALVVAAGPEAAPRSLQSVTQAEWREILAAHRGDLVVVDFWATWCLPCLERFPAMVELSERYSGDGVAFIAFSLDDREDAGALRQAERFIAEQGGRIEHYITADTVLDAFEQLELLSLPAVKIFARDGTLAHTLDANDPNHQFTDEDVEAEIRRLLAE